MKSSTWLVTIVVLIALAVPALAGPKDAEKAEQAAHSDKAEQAAKSDKAAQQSKASVKYEKKQGKKCEADAQTCLNNMYAKLMQKGWLGIEMDKVDGDDLYTIIHVVSESPAETAGFLVGDVFAGVNGMYLKDTCEEDMKQASKSIKPNAEVTYVVLRDSEQVELTATLAPVPEDVLARWIGSHMLEHAEHADTASLNND